MKMISETINTSSAGFLATPGYMAHIVGPRTFTVGTRVFAILDQLSVIDATKDEFELFGLVYIVPNKPTNKNDPITTAEVNDINDQIKKVWQIVWNGIER